MKKGLLFVGILAVAIAALGLAGFAYAQAPTPQPPTGFGPGMMGGRGGMMGGGGGMMGGYGSQSTGSYGPLHTYMIAAMAEAFGMTPEELQSLHDEGKTGWDIAQEQGLTQEEFIALMTEARTQAVQQAVADGVITQEQADWMLSRMQNMGGYGAGTGTCPGMGGGFGGGRGGRGGGRWNNQPAQPSTEPSL